MKIKNIFKLKIKIKKLHLNLIRVTIIAIFLPITIFFIFYFGKIYPGVYVAGENLSGKTPEEAIKILSRLSGPSKITLVTTSENSKTFEIPVESIDLKYDYTKTADAAFRYGRSGNPIWDINQILEGFINTKSLGLRFSINEDSMANSIFTIAGQVGEDPIYPSAKLVEGKLIVDKGKKGNDLDANMLRINIGQELSKSSSKPIEIPIENIDPTLNTFEESLFSKRAEGMKSKIITLTFEEKSFVYTGNDILSLLYPKGGYDKDKISLLSKEIAKLLNRAPQEAKFSFDNSQKKVNTFQPSKDGISVNQEELSNLISQKLTEIESLTDTEAKINVPVSLTPPVVKTGDINNLGIKELIGRGTSIFRGSIPSRVFNVNLAASRVNGTLVAPGETFSFNTSVGDISELSGYQKAYIIQNGKTILGDGGGVCQVSTTLFRAAMNAGLPITDRSPHAYRVYYYEQDAPPGFDATVYSPTVDFKFKNDTPGHILVQAISDPKNYSLTFEFYGTKDGRVSEVGKPVITKTSPPPEDVYQDDPTLPAGTVKQTEHKALGTNLYFVYKVTKNGETTFQKTFYSNYKPWGNVFLRGTGV